MYQKLGTFAMGALALTLLSGCEYSLDNDADDKAPAAEKIEVSGNISDAQLEAAVEKYIQNNKVAFGKQVIAAAEAAQQADKADEEAKKQEAMKSVPDVRDDEYVLVDKNADIIMFEYSDYHCPFCKRFHPTSHQAQKDSNIAVVFRAMPLVHANTATPIHEIAECVGAKSGGDAFWKFSDVVFEKGEAVTTDNYKDELKTLKIANIDAIEACYKAGDMKERVQKTIQEGYALGINGTPTSILKNVKTGEIRVVGGALPYTAPAEAPYKGVKALIEELRK